MNSYPEIKKFLKSPGGVDEYPDVEVKFIPGHNPDLVIGDKRIDLTKYKTHSALHELFDANGFRRAGAKSAMDEHKSPTKPIPDKSSFCASWAEKGECEKNPRFMKTTCPMACLKYEL